MLIPDVNVLINAHNRASQLHERSREWWETALNSDHLIGLPWVVVLGFIRITTNRRIIEPPLTVTEALDIVRDWLEKPTVHIITPGDRHAEILFDLLEALGAAGNLTTDAHIAALAIEYHAEVATINSDFNRLPGVRWFNPVAASRRRR